MRPIGEFERAVLLTVSRLGDRAYGISVRDEIEKHTGRSISIGAVYTTLDRLLAKKMISTWTGEPTPQRGGRAKKFFRIEGRGVEALEQARKASEAIWAIGVMESES